MTQNPFSPQAQMVDYEEPQRPRMSVLAVISLVFGVVCCPGAGALATVFGTAALFRISRSQGRLRGTGLAIAGIIIGLIMTAVYVGVAMAAVSFFQKLNADCIPVIQAIEKEDTPALQTYFSPGSGVTLSNADVKAFHSKIDAKAGKYVAMPGSLIEYVRWLFGPAGEGYGKATGGRATPGTIPQPVKYSNETVFVVFEIDLMSGGGGGVAPGSLQNVGVAFNDGTIEYLVNKKSGAPAPVPTPAPAPNP